MPQLESYALREDLLPELPAGNISIDVQHDLLEAALRMDIAARCQRAYVHDLNNSLQPVFAGMEVLIRAATAGTHAPVEQVVDFAKLAVSQHKLSMEALIGTLIGPDTPSAQVDLNDLLQKLSAFLMHDAFQHHVKLSLQLGVPVQVHARTSKLRLMFLVLLVDAIDALPEGGSVAIDAEHQLTSVTISVSDSRCGSAESAMDAHPQQRNSLRAALLLPVLRRIAAQEGGDIDIAASAGRYQARITLPRLA